METKLSSPKKKILPLIEDVLIPLLDGSGKNLLEEGAKKSDGQFSKTEQVIQTKILHKHNPPLFD